MMHHKAVFAICLFLLPPMSCVSADAKHGKNAHKSYVEMNVLFENATGYVKSVKFNAKMFTRFFKCLCKLTTEQCVVQLQMAGPSSDVKDVQFNNFTPNNEVNSTCYKCIARSNLDKEVHCMKLINASESCHAVSNTDSYQLPERCDFNCVTLLWTQREIENLSTSIHDVLASCPGATTTSAPGRSSPISIATSTSTKSLEAGSAASSDNTTGVVVGVVIGILILIIIGVLLFILWRRGKCVFKRFSRSHPGLSSSLTGNRTQRLTTLHPYLHHPTDESFSSSNVFSKLDLTPQDGINHTFKKDQHADGHVNSSDTSSPFNNGKAVSNVVNTDYGYTVAHALESDNDLKERRPGVHPDVGILHENGNVKISDDFEYSKAKAPNSIVVDGPSCTRNGDKDKNDTSSTRTNNLENIFQQKKKNVGENTKIQSLSVTNLGGEYDYAMPEDGGDSVAQQNKESVSTGTEASGGISANGIYEYCTADSNNHSEDPDAKSTSVETDFATAEDDYALSEDYTDYSLSTDTSPQPKHVYSKLGEKIRHTTNPYNVLLHPKEDPKKRQKLPTPSSNTEPANQKSTYSFAQPISENTTNPIAVINVNPPSSQNGAISSDQKDDQGLSRSHFTLSTDKDIAPDNKHTYFELEKQEDNEDSVSSCSGESV